MPAIIRFLVSTIAGALIGYTTNYIAIVMLFRPYKKVWFIQGVIPAKIEDFINRLSEGGMNLAKDISTDKESQKLITNFIEREALSMSIPTKIIFSVLANSMFVFDRNKFVRIKEHGVVLIGTLINSYLNGVDMRDMEKLVRDTLNKEFVMLEIYGLILGAIMGALTFLVNGVLR